MQVIQNILLKPPFGYPDILFIKGDFSSEESYILLNKGNVISFDTFANSLYFSYIEKFSNLNNLFLCLKGKGLFRVYIYNSGFNTKKTKILEKKNIFGG